MLYNFHRTASDRAYLFKCTWILFAINLTSYWNARRAALICENSYHRHADPNNDDGDSIMRADTVSTQKYLSRSLCALFFVCNFCWCGRAKVTAIRRSACGSQIDKILTRGVHNLLKYSISQHITTAARVTKSSGTRFKVCTQPHGGHILIMTADFFGFGWWR